MGIEDFAADSKSKSALDNVSARQGDPSNDELKPRELKKLHGYDTIFILDDSTSMTWSMDQSIADAQWANFRKHKKYLGPVGETRWEVASGALASLVKDAGRCDEDGIDIHFLNDHSVGRGLKDVDAAKEVIQGVFPKGGTPIGLKLNQILYPYLQELEGAKSLKRGDPDRPKPLNIVVITDGAATDRDVLRKTIVETTKVLDKLHCTFDQVGIQFVQIGRDKEAEKFLKELDDNLTKGWFSAKRATRDIVDTVICTGQSKFSAALLAKILTGGIDRRIDDQPSDGKAKKEQLCY
ncbi:hypothetical protein BDZ89DRAFT_1042580 [Hymenopellis radicata]|nr:hypothetical protein BDZ89DRAFT_1042580 [Hymenopellis radicata]